MTIASLTDDILIALGFSHDDALRSRIAVMRNVKMAVDKVQSQILGKAIKGGDTRSISDMLSVFTVDVTNHEALDNGDWDYHSFVLPVELYSLQRDGAISFIRYNRIDLPPNCPPQIARVRFTGTTLAALSTIYDSTYQKPSPSQPYYARNKDRVYIYGVDPSITKLLIGLYASIPAFEDIDPDEELTLPDEYYYAVKKMILDLERWVLQIPQQRLKNDGRDLEPEQTVRTERPVSLNDPLMSNE